MAEAADGDAGVRLLQAALLAAIEQALARGLATQRVNDKLEALARLVSGLTPRERQVCDRPFRIKGRVEASLSTPRTGGKFD